MGPGRVPASLQLPFQGPHGDTHKPAPGGRRDSPAVRFLGPRALGECELFSLAQKCQFQVLAGGVSTGMQNDADHMQIHSVHPCLQRKPAIVLSVVGTGEVQVHVRAFMSFLTGCEVFL